MRLLTCDGAGNVRFTKDLPEAELAWHQYAILSHTWGPDEDEVTYDDIRHGTGTDKAGYEKIRFCARQAGRDGLDYFWVDTCCIDKTNNAELSKSLISMFRWYATAERCYVFLADVPRTLPGPDPPQSQMQGQGGGEDWARDFRCSRWFERGWTLQELVAPSRVEFFSKQGESLGTKATLERQVGDITRIPVDVLRGQPLCEYSVHERRRWQDGRETREPEDLVYSLLGICGVSMPVLYGEGRVKAQERLENEIHRTQRGEWIVEGNGRVGPPPPWCLWR